jgi:hypothetical protein
MLKIYQQMYHKSMLQISRVTGWVDARLFSALSVTPDLS